MAKATTTKKVELHLAGQPDGIPTFQDVLRLFTNLTGREPTAKDVREARAAYDRGVVAHAKKKKATSLTPVPKVLKKAR